MKEFDTLCERIEKSIDLLSEILRGINNQNIKIMKYKVGNKVRIKSVEWYDANKDKDGVVNLGGDIFSFVAPMAEYLGKEATITTIVDDGVYLIDLDGGNAYWVDEMFEGLVSVEKPIISTDLIKDIAEVIKTHNLGVSVSENEGKLIIEPLKVEEEKDLPIDTPCMVSDNGEDWGLRYYANNHRVFVNGNKSKVEDNTTMFDFTIPCSQFNFENPSESLKYNIVKNNQ